MSLKIKMVVNNRSTEFFTMIKGRLDVINRIVKFLY